MHWQSLLLLVMYSHLHRDTHQKETMIHAWGGRIAHFDCKCVFPVSLIEGGPKMQGRCHWWKYVRKNNRAPDMPSGWPEAVSPLLSPELHIHNYPPAPSSSSAPFHMYSHCLFTACHRPCHHYFNSACMCTLWWSQNTHSHTTYPLPLLIPGHHTNYVHVWLMKEAVQPKINWQRSIRGMQSPQCVWNFTVSQSLVFFSISFGTLECISRANPNEGDSVNRVLMESWAGLSGHALTTWLERLPTSLTS